MNKVAKIQKFDIGGYVVITHELNSPFYLIVGIDGIKLGVVDALKLCTEGPQLTPTWLDRSLFEKPNTLQREQFAEKLAAHERAVMARNLGENLR